jgi:acyl carrier protein
MTAERIANGPVTSDRIEQILITKTGADPQGFEDAGGLSLAELGIDSLAVLELEAVVADEFGLVVPEDALSMTVTEIVTHINSQAARI